MSSYPKIITRFKQWLTIQADIHYSALTCHYYLKIIQAFLHFVDAYGISRLNDVSLELLQKFITQKPDHSLYKPKTMLVRQAALALFYSWACKHHFCSENVFLRYRKAQVQLKAYNIEPLEKATDQLIILSEDEQQHLLHTLQSSTTFIEKRTAAIISLILATGLHREEICQLTLQDFHWDKSQLSVTVGTKKRAVDINKALCKKSMEDWLQARQDVLQGKACEWVFFTERLKPLRNNKLSLYMRLLFEKAGISSDKATPDSLRQTAIFQWITKKIPLEKLQQQFGFKQIASLKRYLDAAC